VYLLVIVQDNENILNIWPTQQHSWHNPTV